jgi:hypothetical protein
MVLAQTHVLWGDLTVTVEVITAAGLLEGRVRTVRAVVELDQTDVLRVYYAVTIAVTETHRLVVPRKEIANRDTGFTGIGIFLGALGRAGAAGTDGAVDICAARA